MKKRIIIIISALFLALLITVICYSQLAKNERKTSYTEPIVTAEPETTQQETTEIGKTYLAEFKPFECSGDYYCFDMYNLKDKYGKEISHTYDEETKVYSLKTGNTEIFSCNVQREYDIGVLSVIDNSVFIQIDYILYRVELTYDKNGNINDSSLSLVAESDYMHPVKAYDNILILYRLDVYFQLNTLDGTISETDFHTLVDSTEVNPKISYDKACDLAFKAIEDINNYEPEYTQPYKASDYYMLEDSTELIKNPDLQNQNVIHELYPELVWHMCMHTDEYGNNFNIEVFINADTGKVSAMSVYDMGC